jgi:hypothetical protein
MGSYNQAGGSHVATIRKTKVRIDELSEVMRRLNQEPIPPDVLDRRRKLSAETRKVRGAMEPLEEDVKDIIRRQRGEDLTG